MNVRRLSCLPGADAARGIAVIIDVFRAFTCEPLMVHLGARSIRLESDIERCLATRGDALLVGELNEVPIEGFDLTNSPFLILQHGAALFEGRAVIHRTTAGVTGALTALDKADELLPASYVNAAATARYIRARRPDVVSIVAMGMRAIDTAPEDERCGDYIESLLTGGTYDHIAALNEILANETAKRFLLGNKPYLPTADPLLCLQRDIFDIALRAERREGGVYAVPAAVGA